MPRAGAIIFIKLDLLRVACDKRGRDGSHDLGRLIEKRGREAKFIDWPDELTAECPKKIAHNMNDPCGAGAGIWRGCCSGVVGDNGP
jgi:hypothetical protein